MGLLPNPTRRDAPQLVDRFNEYDHEYDPRESREHLEISSHNNVDGKLRSKLLADSSVERVTHFRFSRQMFLMLEMLFEVRHKLERRQFATFEGQIQFQGSR